jgi:protein O-GlcNAc transferase
MSNVTKRTTPPPVEVKNLINLYNHKRLLEAAALGEELARKYPKASLVYDVLGAVYMALENLNKAIENYQKLLLLDSKHTEALNNMGMALYDQGRFNEAIASLNSAVKIEPDFADAHYNLGNALAQVGELEKAAESYRNCLAISPADAQVLSNYGNVLKDCGEFDRAITCYSKAIKIQPNYAAAYNNMGNVLQDKGEAKLAVDYYKKALKIKKEYPSAHNNMGNALQDMDDLEGAIDSYKQAIKLKPNFAKAYNNLGTALQNKGNIIAAIESYSKAFKLNPKDHIPFFQKVHQQSHICDWVKIKEDQNLISKLGLYDQPIEPFCFLPIEDTPERHKAQTEIYAKKKHKQTQLPLSPHLRRNRKRLRIGYFSTDFKQHPVSYLLARVIETHDRNCFEIYGYSLGPVKDDQMRRRLIKAFDVFQDVKNMSDQNVALLARRDEIEIAIDLTGYTQGNRSGIFAYRAAPIQINYLGFPGTMGVDFIDYIIADQNLIPSENQKFYSEKPIYLPHHFQAQDDTLSIADHTPSRSELSLPEHGFVFCGINNSYKISPSEFDIWMRLLKNIDGSVLWLLESNEWVKKNLCREAINRGISSDRLVFTYRVTKEKYLSQFRQADLFLDTFTYNAGATASNALWAGLPVLTKLGKSYTARMAGSLLTSLGLPDLITKSELEYEELALQLGTDPKRLSAIRQRLSDNRLSKPLFNTELFTKHLEEGYRQAYQNYLDYEKPKIIYVKP